MREVAIIPDKTKKESVEVAKKVAGWLRNNSISPVSVFDEKVKPDLVIILGGDGFITRTSCELAEDNLPFVAVNFGDKGFLAVAEKNNWPEIMEKVIQGKYVIEKRPLLDIVIFNANDSYFNIHLKAAGNIYVRHREDMIILSVNIDGKPAYQKFEGDGVIVANATGATGYNLSAGGALISSGLVITPICPHSLSVKSLPILDSKVIEIIYHGRKSLYRKDEGCLLFTDSESYSIEPGERIVVQKSSEEVSFVIPDGFSFIESLQNKLGLSR